MLVQGAFNALFRPGLRADFRDSYEQYPPEFTSFLKTSTMSTPELRAVVMSGLNRLVEIGDGEPVTYDDPNISPVVMGVDKEFALGFALTRKTVEDDQYGKANQSAKWLGYATRMTEEYRSAQLLDDAFAGSTFKGYDNLSLCNTAHTLLGSNSTVSNALSTPVQLSTTGIVAMQNLAMRMVDNNGNPMRLMPNKLVISNVAGELNMARQIFSSEKEPFTANNTDNALKMQFGAPEIVISRYKSSTKSYFMIDDMLNDAHFVTRRAPLMEDDFDFNTATAQYKVSTRFLIWFVDYRGWFGANPS
jgi:hypothetical protein